MAALSPEDMAALADRFRDVPPAQFAVLERGIEHTEVASVRVGDHTHRYLRAGRGASTVVLVPAALVSPLMWFHVIDSLIDDYRLLIPVVPPAGFAGAEEAVAVIDAIRRTERVSAIMRRLPDRVLRAILGARSRSGKGSPWYGFRRAFFAWAASDLTKADYLALFENNLRFYREVEHLPIGEVGFAGRTVVLGTRSDRDTFSYHPQLVDLYPQGEGHVFDEPGGHHMVFLYPEAYTARLRAVLP
ncbi:MAG: hypothetical protein AAGD35_03100 [Actinomycetota bacterium]